jgi:hypothetical protein
MGVAQTKSYLEFEPDRPILADRFNTAKMSMDALRANGLSQLVCSPELAKGDILAFTNFTMHSTYVTPAMTQSRIGVEARVDLKGFAF